MNLDNLVVMANQIGAFFEAMPDRDEALEGISSHLRKFWAPRMREQLAGAVARGEALALSSIVIEALRTHSILPRAAALDPPEPRSDRDRRRLDGASEA